MPETTEALILKTIQELHSAGVDELSARLGITPSGIRYHLAKLRSGGWIEECPPLFNQRPPGRGRPARHFRLPLARIPDNLSGLCLALLQLPQVASRQALDDVAQRMAHPPSSDQATIHQRLVHAVDRLNQMNYQAGWEAGPSGPRLRLNNCPYAQIWSGAPHLCQLDEALLSRLTGATARQSQRTSFNVQGPSSCLFEILYKG